MKKQGRPDMATDDYRNGHAPHVCYNPEHAALVGIANPAAVPEVIQATRLFWNWAQPLYRCPCCQGLVHEKGCLVANLGDALTAVDKKGE